MNIKLYGVSRFVNIKLRCIKICEYQVMVFQNMKSLSEFSLYLHLRLGYFYSLHFKASDSKYYIIVKCRVKLTFFLNINPFELVRIFLLETNI